jgi:dihydroorotate dehydrogenase (NAD+) catalytic subunit
VLVNVAGATVDDYVTVLARLAGTDGVTAFEINASCPNTSAGGLEFGADDTSLANLVRRCRAATTRPLVIKLSPVLPDIARTAQVARDAGADGLSLVNTMPATLNGRLGNGFGGMSGPALLPVGVLAVRKVRARMDLPLIGVGGIRTAADVREYLTAGADLVAVGTAALADPGAPERIVRGLARG